MKHALAITLVLLGVPHAARAAADPPAIVVATIASGDVVYALDAESGQVSFAAVPAQLPASIPLDAMTGLELPRGIRVAAMGLRRDRLIFVDVGGKRPALREMELQSGAIYDVRTDADFQRPIALAVSPSGEIAVADQTRRAMLWLRDQEPSQAVPWPDGVARLAQVQFDGRSLVGLDADSGRIVSLAPPALTKQIAPPVQISEAPLAGLRAFAVFRGIYYLSNGTALFALAPRGVCRARPVHRR